MSINSEKLGLYRQIDVWCRKKEGVVIRYRCFEDLRTGCFSVQSADFFREPVTADQASQFERQSVELLVEESPFIRAGSFTSIEAAIANHETSFGSEEK